MRFFCHGREVILADSHERHVPAVGAIVWIRYQPWRVLQATPVHGGEQLNVCVVPA